ncbi:transposase InsO family protein [Sphingobium sp. B1D3A]|uniref:Transposase InsO family protein n=1 Tax=Sphingobium lignivorans TaxID=2735886 RepID=A0ABR6NHC1_9SPHN|nr:transposase InsO family protein [Sphingobium lignivorans]
MIAFIDDHRDAYGVEPICRVLPIAPSTYHERVAKRQDPTHLSARAQRDVALKPEVARVFAENFAVYGVRKVWRQMMREGFPVARCTVARLLREMGLAGVIRGKPVRTTISDKAAPCPLDHVNRRFYAPAPNMLWVSDFTYVATWAGFVYVAFVIDTYAWRIVGWRASRTAHASFVLDALEQALHDRRPAASAIATTTLWPRRSMALYKAEVIHRRGPWRSFEAVEYATLEWVDWFNRLATDHAARRQLASYRQRAGDRSLRLCRIAGQGGFSHLAAIERRRSVDLARRQFRAGLLRSERSCEGAPHGDTGYSIARRRPDHPAQSQHPADYHDPARRARAPGRSQGSDPGALA